MFCVALTMLMVLLFVKGRQGGEKSVVTALSVVTKPSSVLQVSGDVMYPGIYQISDIKMTNSVIQMAIPLCNDLSATDMRQLLTGMHTANAVHILCEGPLNKAVIKQSIMKTSQCLTLGIPLDINQMTEADLEMLPGVGPVLAHRIIIMRQANGGFGSLDELLQVDGVGEKKLIKLSHYFNVPIQQKK
jgi:competence protein ComEA